MGERNSFDVEIDGVCCYALESIFYKLSAINDRVKACEEPLGYANFPYHAAKQLTKACLELEDLVSRMQPIFDPHTGTYFVGDVDNPYYADYKECAKNIIPFPMRHQTSEKIME